MAQNSSLSFQNFCSRIKLALSLDARAQFHAKYPLFDSQPDSENSYSYVILSPLSEKARVSPFADGITKATLSLQLFKDPECWSGCGFESATSPAVALCSINRTGQRLAQLVGLLSLFTSKQF